MAAGGGLADAAAVLVLLHGRGDDPSSMGEPAARLDLPDVVWTAPAAPGGSWYPLRFIEPRAANEPALSEAIAAVERTLDDVLSAGAALERLVLGGFSQGACLACDVLA